ncbi:hypothetical protein F0224_20030 [Vibrio coralliilyticus]|uniref:winged helix-turn-helix domain-containing protein n=1 Tax=Vibrio coralliilyticus TaxID=190893 RepID=UPI000BAC1593|nr:winged helix-turn-helix domain-containing protein [Vibrio coralliilyticus]NOI77977.1 hypothetical protein [Vibrio coralliilyticus]PAW00690.1 hypothetical protein CKJ79_25515 [Vibrio coralliilyticus]
MNLLEKAKSEQCNIAIADLTYNPVDKTLHSKQGEISLEPRNLALLEILLTNVGNPTSIEEFIESVWESQYISKNVVTNRISLLRNLFREHSEEADPSKIIITYPKRGYYIPESGVQLVAKTSDSNKAPQAANKIVEKKQTALRYFSWSLNLILSAIAVVFAIHTWSHFEEDKKSNTLHIPQVRLLLDSINHEEQSLNQTVLRLKALILHSQSCSPYIHLSNMSSPTYYLQSLSEHDNFPGSEAFYDSDYTLSFNLWEDTNGVLNLESLLHHSASGRVAWRKIYHLQPPYLAATINQLNVDLSEYFKLPQPIKPLSSKLSSQIVPVSELTLEQLLSRQLSGIEVLFYTRELLFTQQSSDGLKSWIKKVRKQTPVPPPDLHMLLALLTYRSGEVERSLRMLQREYVTEIPENALILLLQANINRKIGNKQMYVAHYLKAISALTSTIEAERVLDHYSSPDRQQSCLDLWREALKDVKYIQESQSVLWQGIEQFCQPYD